MKNMLLASITITLCVSQHALAAKYIYDNLNRLSEAWLDASTKIVYDYDASGNRHQRLVTVLPDLDADGTVGFDDFAALAAQWLQSPSDPSADIAPWPEIDNIVDFKDLQMLACHWLEGMP